MKRNRDTQLPNSSIKVNPLGTTTARRHQGVQSGSTSNSRVEKALLSQGSLVLNQMQAEGQVVEASLKEKIDELPSNQVVDFMVSGEPLSIDSDTLRRYPGSLLFELAAERSRLLSGLLPQGSSSSSSSLESCSRGTDGGLAEEVDDDEEPGAAGSPLILTSTTSATKNNRSTQSRSGTLKVAKISELQQDEEEEGDAEELTAFRPGLVPLDSQGRIVIDRDPTVFRYMLNLLRGYKMDCGKPHLLQNRALQQNLEAELAHFLLDQSHSTLGEEWERKKKKSEVGRQVFSGLGATDGGSLLDNRTPLQSCTVGDWVNSGVHWATFKVTHEGMIGVGVMSHEFYQLQNTSNPVEGARLMDLLIQPPQLNALNGEEDSVEQQAVPRHSNPQQQPRPPQLPRALLTVEDTHNLILGGGGGPGLFGEHLGPRHSGSNVDALFNAGSIVANPPPGGGPVDLRVDPPPVAEAPPPRHEESNARRQMEDLRHRAQEAFLALRPQGEHPAGNRGLQGLAAATRVNASTTEAAPPLTTNTYEGESDFKTAPGCHVLMNDGSFFSNRPLIGKKKEEIAGLALPEGAMVSVEINYPRRRVAWYKGTEMVMAQPIEPVSYPASSHMGYGGPTSQEKAEMQLLLYRTTNHPTVLAEMEGMFGAEVRALPRPSGRILQDLPLPKLSFGLILRRAAVELVSMTHSGEGQSEYPLTDIGPAARDANERENPQGIDHPDDHHETQTSHRVRFHPSSYLNPANFPSTTGGEGNHQQPPDTPVVPIPTIYQQQGNRVGGGGQPQVGNAGGGMRFEREQTGLLLDPRGSMVRERTTSPLPNAMNNGNSNRTGGGGVANVNNTAPSGGAV